MVRPATPPTTPPTTVGVDGALLLPDPAPAPDVDEGDEPAEVPVAPPIPPGTTPAPEVVLVGLDDRVEDSELVDELLVVDKELFMVEVV